MAKYKVEDIRNIALVGHGASGKTSLADTLRGVVCQTLVRGKDGHSRHVAVEVLLGTDAVANLIRKGKTMQLPSLIATSREAGMQSMEQDLERLAKAGLVDETDVATKAKAKRDVS